MIFIKDKDGGVIFHIHVIPRSGKSNIVGVQDDALKIKITAPPVEGQANAECIRFLADILGVRKNQVTITSGQKSKKKTVAVDGLKREDMMTILSRIMPS